MTNPLVGCRKVYLDMGLNVGEKLFVLYEPLKGRRRQQQPFSNAFGNTTRDRNNVCAVGFEPNPKHFRKLSMVLRLFEEKGRRLFIFNAAVALRTGRMQLFSDTDHPGLEELGWGKSLIEYDARMANRTAATVPTISLPWFLKTYLIPQPGTDPPRVLAKMVRAWAHNNDTKINLLAHSQSS